jgi:tRNA/rRNA methyltransferase
MIPAPIIVLVHPQMGENIGATARAMANFGLDDLRLVAPRDGWPNPKANSLAVGAEFILDQAKLTSTLAEALADTDFSCALSLRPRDIAVEAYQSPQLPEILAHKKPSRWALVFGPERTGLDNDSISACSALIAIPTSPVYPSMNLAQAVVVMAYEWSRCQHSLPEMTAEIASHDDITQMVEHLVQVLESKRYFKVADKQPIMVQNLRGMMQRARFSTQEVRTLRGIIRALGSE